MSIASRITEIEQHLIDDYSVLTLAGADLTNVDKNIVNLKPTWKERLLYFMNNGTDIVWNNWEKVNATGESATMNQTIQAPMKIDLKGNTYQNGTPTPESPQDIQVVSGDNSIKVEGKNLAQYDTNDYTSSVLGSLGSFNITLDNSFNVKNGEEYYFSADIKLNSGTATTLQVLRSGDVGGGGQSTNFISNPNLTSDYQRYISKVTFTQDVTLTKIAFQLTGQANNAVIEVRNLMISKINASYTPYVSQTYPITLGSNLYNPNFRTSNNIIQCINGSASEQNGVYTLSATGSDLRIWVQITPGTSYNDTAGQLFEFIGNEYTMSITNDLFKKNFVTFYDKNKVSLGFIEKTSNIFTISQNEVANAKYFSIRIGYGSATSGTDYTLSVQLQKGSQASPYEPYNPFELCKIGEYQDRIVKDNGKWYLHKEIGKVVLNGSEDWSLNESGTGYSRYALTNNATTTNYSNTIVAMSDKFIGSKDTDVINSDADANRICIVSKHRFIIKTIDNNLLTLQAFETWLSTHNTIVYYVLATPTNTEITDTTLLSQLNALEGARSYDNQTNVSQVNNDYPFIVSATALEMI